MTLRLTNERIKELNRLRDELSTLADEIHSEENENLRAASASLRKAGWLVEDAIDSLRRETNVHGSRVVAAVGGKLMEIRT